MLLLPKRAVGPHLVEQALSAEGHRHVIRRRVGGHQPAHRGRRGLRIGQRTERLPGRTERLPEFTGPCARQSLETGGEPNPVRLTANAARSVVGIPPSPPRAKRKDRPPDPEGSIAPHAKAGHPLARYSGPIVVLANRSEEHTSELQSLRHLVCRLLL